MDKQFKNGYALLIGVNQNNVPAWALPDVAKDVDAVAAVLTHPDRCAYPTENVRVLLGEAASRNGIIGGIKWLRERLQSDASGNTTAVVYYSGHGWSSTESDLPAYYLIPYDADQDTFPLCALRAEDFAALVAGLKPQRLLVVMDACHSGGMSIKDVGEMSASVAGYAGAAIPPGVLLGQKGAGQTAAAQPAAKGNEVQAQGSGRAVLCSSSRNQASWIRKDRSMSIFTYHFIAALTGHAQAGEGACKVLVTDLMSYVTRHVPASARSDYGADQQPEFQMSGGSFVVAPLLGGKGLSKGEAAPDPIQPLPATGTTQILTGGGDYYGKVDTGGGAFAPHGEIVLGDKFQGDKVMGDKVMGDKVLGDKNKGQ